MTLEIYLKTMEFIGMPLAARVGMGYLKAKIEMAIIVYFHYLQANTKAKLQELTLKPF